MSDKRMKIEIQEDPDNASNEERSTGALAGQRVQPEQEQNSRSQEGGKRFQVSDRRFWANDETAVDQATPPPERLPSYLQELKARTEAAENKLREKLDQLEAENEAYRARLRRELETRAEQQTMCVLESLLEVVDNLERALEAAQSSGGGSALEEGVKLNLELFLDKLRAAGIEALELAGKAFDPHLAEAVGTIPVDSPDLDQTILEEIQRGYLFRDQLLRPARVRIGHYEE